MATPPRKGPLLLGASRSGLVVFLAFSGLTHLVAPFRVWLFSPLVQVLVGLAAVLLGTMFLLWGRLPGAADRGAYVAAVLVMGLLLVLFQAGAPALGWLGGPVTEAPLLMQGVIYGLSLAAFGFLPPVVAAAAQSLPDIGILGNSARLLRQKQTVIEGARLTRFASPEQYAP